MNTPDPPPAGSPLGSTLTAEEIAGEPMCRCEGCGMFWMPEYPGNDEACIECGGTISQEPSHVLMEIGAHAALSRRLAQAEERCVEIAETMMHASERIAEVEDWLVLWRDGGKVGPVEHEIAACKQASWYLWNSETAEEIHRIAALAPTAPSDGAARDGAR